MTDASDKLMGMIPTLVSAKIVTDMSDRTFGKKKKKAKKLELV